MFRVTAARVRDAYGYLRSLPPFNKWDLPAPGALEFRLSRDVSQHGAFEQDGKRAIIVNPETHVTLDALLITVAHEMVHLRQAVLGRLNTATQAKAHNAEFQRWAKSVCVAMGWDPQRF